MMMTSRHIYLCKAIFSLLPHICNLRHLRHRCKIFTKVWKNTQINAKRTQPQLGNTHPNLWEDASLRSGARLPADKTDRQIRRTK